MLWERFCVTKKIQLEVSMPGTCKTKYINASLLWVILLQVVKNTMRCPGLVRSIKTGFWTSDPSSDELLLKGHISPAVLCYQLLLIPTHSKRKIRVPLSIYTHSYKQRTVSWGYKHCSARWISDIQNAINRNSSLKNENVVIWSFIHPHVVSILYKFISHVKH